MDIGTEIERITVEPLEDPVPREEPAPTEVPTEIEPERERLFAVQPLLLRARDRPLTKDARPSPAATSTARRVWVRALSFT